MAYCRNEGFRMLRKIVTGFALLLLTVIAVTQSIDVYNTHFSSDTEQFVVTSLGVHEEPWNGLYRLAVMDHGNVSAFVCKNNGVVSKTPKAMRCGYVTYLDPVGQETTIYMDESESCFKDSVIAELLPMSCRN